MRLSRSIGGVAETLAILAAIAGLALSGCGRSAAANNVADSSMATDSSTMAASSGAAPADSGATASPSAMSSTSAGAMSGVPASQSSSY